MAGRVYKTRPWIDALTAIMKKSGAIPEPSARMMKYPYTLTAKFAHFPYRFYYEYTVWPRYYIVGTMLAWLLVIRPIHNLANCDANKKKTADVKRRWKEQAHEAELLKEWYD